MSARASELATGRPGLPGRNTGLRRGAPTEAQSGKCANPGSDELEPSPELFVLFDRFGALATFTSSAAVEAHVDGLEPNVRDRARVVRYVRAEELDVGDDEPDPWGLRPRESPPNTAQLSIRPRTR